MTNTDLINIAKNARKNALANSSKYKVGVALLTKNLTVYIGANIEDEKIPSLSSCAERVAIQNAISHGEREFERIAIVGGYEDNISDTLVPCAVCLQYMQDFCANIKIVIYSDGVLKEGVISDFLNFPY